MAIVTRDTLTEMLHIDNSYNNMHDVGNALVVLLNNQTDGFTSADARTGSITAKYYIRHQRLEEWQIQMWAIKNAKGVPRLAKYHMQINKAAEAKAEKEKRVAYVRAKTI